MGEKTPRIIRINCKMKDFEAGEKHGLFIGCWLINKFGEDAEKIRSGLKNSWFQGLMRNDLKKFIKNENTDVESVEKHFDKYIGIYEGFRVRDGKFYHGQIIRYPKQFIKGVWFDNIQQTKRNNSKNVEFQLLINFDSRKLIIAKETSKKKYSNSTQTDLTVSDLSNLMFLLTGQKNDYGPLFMGNISAQEAKCKINIILLEPDPTEPKGKKIVRQKPFLVENTTVHLLIACGVSQKLLEPIEDFKFLIRDSGIPEFYICDVTSKCKYKTNIKANFERHKVKCEELSKKKIICKQKAYGDDSSTLRKMVRFFIFNPH